MSGGEKGGGGMEGVVFFGGDLIQYIDIKLYILGIGAYIVCISTHLQHLTTLKFYCPILKGVLFIPD